MKTAALALLALTLPGVAPDEGPAAWVARLGAGTFAGREEAADRLRKIGPPALPALREALSSRDPEVRDRAAALIEEIEAMAVLGPTMVRLDFHDRPLAEVVAALNRRSGMTIVPGSRPGVIRITQSSPDSTVTVVTITTGPGSGGTRPSPSWPDRNVTLEAPEPVPFWEAVTRLCRAAGLRRDDSGPYLPWGRAFGELVLVPGEAAPPATDFGAFHVELVRIHREQDLNLTPGRDAPGGFRQGFADVFVGPVLGGGPDSGPGVSQVRRSSFIAELNISAEPRLRIFAASNLEGVDVRDDHGRPALREPTPQEARARAQMLAMNPHLDPRLHPELRFGSGAGASSTTRRVVVPLSDALPHGGRLAVLKGRVAVAVIAREADPPTVPLADAREKSAESRGARLTVHEVGIKPGQWNAEVELTYEPSRSGAAPPPGETIRVQGPGVAPLDIRRPFDQLERQIEVVDGEGRTYHWQFLRPPGERTRGRMWLIVYSPKQPERLEIEKLRLRVWTLIGSAVEIPVSFTDVPLP